MIEIRAGLDWSFLLFGLVWYDNHLVIHIGPLAILFKKDEV